MNKDIRLATSFKGHRKRKRLNRLLGFGAEVYLIDLWLTVAMDCPEGVLKGWDDYDIADACNWIDEPTKLVSAFIECCFLEKNADGDYTLHDWCEHQGWACKAKTRSEAAKKAADARWQKLRKSANDKLQCDRNATASTPQCDSNATVRAPSPSPSPSPLPSPLPLPSLKYTAAIRDFTAGFISHIQQTVGNRAPKAKNLEQSSLDVVDKLIRIDGFDLETIQKVLRWAVRDDFWSTNVYSLAGLRRKKDGLTKFQKILASYEKDPNKHETREEYIARMARERDELIRKENENETQF